MAFARSIDTASSAHINRRAAGFGLLWGIVGLGVAACGGGGGESSDSAQGVPLPSGNATATLTWTSSGDSRVQGYRVYFGTSSRNYAQVKGSGVDAGGAVSYTVTGLQSGQTYYFAVTAYDAARNESDYSAEASKLLA
jgi:hypothetical protein